MVGDSFAMPKNNRDKLRHFFEYDAHALSHSHFTHPQVHFRVCCAQADAHLDRSAAASAPAMRSTASEWRTNGTVGTWCTHARYDAAHSGMLLTTVRRLGARWRLACR
jgi:hypothetical protein